MELLLDDALLELLELLEVDADESRWSRTPAEAVDAPVTNTIPATPATSDCFVYFMVKYMSKGHTIDV